MSQRLQQRPFRPTHLPPYLPPLLLSSRPLNRLWQKADSSDCRKRFSAAVGDPSEVITVTGQDGKTGDSREISYTNCKVVGNGAFGVVVSARVVKIRAFALPSFLSCSRRGREGVMGLVCFEPRWTRSSARAR